MRPVASDDKRRSGAALNPGYRPGAVARTSTFALNNVTLPFVLTLAEEGARRALGEDRHLRNGLNVYEGMITHRAVADALGMRFTPAEAALRL